MPAATLTRVATSTVTQLDNHGEDCQYCSRIGAVVQVQLYYVLEGEREMEDGCKLCMFDRLNEVAALGADGFQWETEEK